MVDTIDTTNTILVLDPVQEMAARAIYLIEENAPNCSECGGSVLRQKCFYDLPYDQCPRHEAADKVKAVVRALEKMSGLKDHLLWRQRVSIYQLVGPPTNDDRRVLKFLVYQGGKFKSPNRTDTFNSAVLRACGHWSARGDTWTFTLSDRGCDYFTETCTRKR